MISLVLALVPLSLAPQLLPADGRRPGPELLPQPVRVSPAGLANLWSFPDDVQRADLDGDGHQDLLVKAITRLVVFPGNGQGTLGGHRFVYSDGALESVAIGDLDEDGHLDLVVLPRATTAQAALWLHNLGDGTFSGAMSLPVTLANYAQVLVTDVDQDDHADVVISTQTGNDLAIVRGNGDGSFAPAASVATLGPGARFATGDLDGDTRAEIVVLVDRPGRRLAVHDTSAAGLLPPVEIPTGGDVVASHRVADLDGDRIADVVWAEKSPGQPSLVMVAAGPALATLPLSEAPPDAEVCEIGDMNGDRRLDLVLLHPDDGRLSVMLARREGGFESPVESVAGPRVEQGTVSYAPTRPVDLVAFPDESRGVLDLAVLNDGGTGSTLNLLRNRGDGSLAAMQRLDEPAGHLRAALGDLDGDGRLDLAVSHVGGLSIHPGNGDGTVSAASEVVAAGDLVDVAMADLDGDGQLDLVASRSNPGTSAENGLWSFLGQGGGAFASGTFRPFTPRIDRLVVGDFDLDGFLDVVSASSLAIYFHHGTGDGTFTPNSSGLSTSSSTIRGLRAGDADSDGRPEALAVVGDQLWLVSYEVPTGSRRTIGRSRGEVAFADLDGDGWLDIAGPGTSSPRAIWWGQGNGLYGIPQTTTGLFANTSAADMDGDGLLDVLEVTPPRFSIGVSRQISPRRFAEPELHVAAAGPQHVEAGDLDGDGLPDLVVCEPAEARVSIHRNQLTFPGFRTHGAARARGAGVTPWIRGEGEARPGGRFDVLVGRVPPGALGLLRLTPTTGTGPRAAGARTVLRLLEADRATGVARALLRLPLDPALAGAHLWLDAVLVEAGSRAPLARTGTLDVLVGSIDARDDAQDDPVR